MSIETNQYLVKNVADIEELAQSVLSADQTSINGRGTYFKALVANTQAELQSPPRFRNVKAGRLTDEDTAAHLKAFESVYGRFHEAIVKVAQAMEPKPDAEALRSRTAFSRSAGSTVRGFIRAGNDIRALAAHKASKGLLSTPRAKRKFSVDSLKKRASSLGEQLAAVAKNLNAANREVAREALGTVFAQLAQAAGMTEHMAREPGKSQETGVAFHDKTGVFVPISLEAVRELRRAA